MTHPNPAEPFARVTRVTFARIRSFNELTWRREPTDGERSLWLPIGRDPVE